MPNYYYSLVWIDGFYFEKYYLLFKLDHRHVLRTGPTSLHMRV